MDGQRTLPSTMPKDVLVAMSTSTTYSGLRASGKSICSISMSRMLYKAPGPCSEIDADQCIQGQLSDLHAQIDELKDSLCDAKKSYCNAEAALTKEPSWVKDLEQELKDLKSRSQVEANASALPPTTMVTVEPKLRVVVPTWSLPQPEAGPSRLPLPQPEAMPSCIPSS